MDNYLPDSPIQNIARKLAMATDSHAEWVEGMSVALPSLGRPELNTPETLQGIYGDSGAGKIHRLKVFSAASQQQSNSAAQDAYTNEDVPEPGESGLRSLARSISVGLTGRGDIKGSIHGLSALGGTAGQAITAGFSGGLSIPVALALQALGGGFGNAAGGVAADKLGEWLVNNAIGGQQAYHEGPKDSEGNLPLGPQTEIAPAEATYSPDSDFAAGAAGTGLGAALTAGGGAIGGALGRGSAKVGARSSLKGFLGIRGPQVNPADLNALRALTPEERNTLFVGNGHSEPGTSAMIVPPRVNTDATQGPRNAGLKALSQMGDDFNQQSGDLVKGIATDAAAQREAQLAATAADREAQALGGKLTDQQRAYAQQKAFLARLEQKHQADLAAAPNSLAQLQRQRNALAAAVPEKAPFGLDTSTPEGQAIRDIMNRTKVTPEDPETIGSAGMGQYRPVERPEALRPEHSTAAPGNALLERALTRSGGDPQGINAENAIAMVEDLGRKVNVPTKQPPITYADVPRTPQQAGAAALSPRASDLELPEVQAALLRKQALLDNLKELQGQIHSTGGKVNSTFDEIQGLSAQTTRAQQAAAEAAAAAQATKAPDFAGQQAAEEILKQKRVALAQFAPQKTETPQLSGTMLSQAKHLAENFLDSKALAKYTFGIRAESPEQTALRATGRLFDTDRFPGGPIHSTPAYGPIDPVSDIFSNPAPSAAEQDRGTIARLFDQYLTHRRSQP